MVCDVTDLVAVGGTGVANPAAGSCMDAWQDQGMDQGMR